VRLAVLLPLLATACTSGNGGAAVVRWRLVDSETGMPMPGCDVPQSSTRAHADQIRLRLTDAVAGIDVDCKSCLFDCAPLEGTTAFEIGAGTYRFSVEALRCGRTVGSAPPPVVRTVQRGEITNLSAIGIAVPPCERTPATCDAPPPGSCADGGN
jgi:hypothetical protein